MRPVSQDLRLRIHEARLAGEPTAEVAERFEVSPAFVRRLMQRQRQGGTLEPRPFRGGPGKRLAPDEGRIRALMAAEPGLTPTEVRDRLKLAASELTVWRFLRWLGLTFKKKSLPAAERDRPDVREARAKWRSAVARRRRTLRRRAGESRVVFVDESSFNTAMTRTHGDAPKGERLHEAVPFAHWKTLSFVAGLADDGLAAPLAVEGALDGQGFATWVEQRLAPALRPGDLVILDNVPTHKTAAVAEAFRRRGVERLHLPPYSPELNPIEQVFSKLKTLVRKAAARTVESVTKAIGDALRRFAPDEFDNYIRHGGYATSS